MSPEEIKAEIEKGSRGEIAQTLIQEDRNPSSILSDEEFQALTQAFDDSEDYMSDFEELDIETILMPEDESLCSMLYKD